MSKKKAKNGRTSSASEEQARRTRPILNSRSSSRSASRSGSRSGSRAGSRRGSVISQESVLHEDNNHEIYSGAGSEIIPSSITSFHYPHSFGSRRKHSGVSRETSPLLEAEDIDLQSVRSYATNASNEEANFKFFKLEEIESAPGGSTFENPEETVDYNTNWEYPIGKHTDELEFELDEDAFEDQHSDQISYVERRRPSEDSEYSEDDLLESEEDTTDKYSNCQTRYQRYYLAEEDIVIGIAGYRDNTPKKLLYYFICVVTFGLGYLVLRWMPRYRINLIGDTCPLGKADWCVVENEYGELAIVHTKKDRFDQRLSSFLNIEDKEEDPIIGHIHSFTYRYLKFFYNPVEDIFKTNNNWYDSNWSNPNSIDDGLSQALLEQRTMIFGDNTIEIEDKSIFALLIEEVLHPFYVFQVFSILLWLVDDYFYYASCIFVISLVSIVNTLVETKSTMTKLRNISTFVCESRVWRNEFWKTSLLSELVPGDIFELDPSLTVVPCDCLLINGEAIINESMLTGESVPVTKLAVPEDQLFQIKDNINLNLSKSYLYNGTKILKKKSYNDEPVKALVVKTGFNTTKGSLVRSMLFPKPIGFKFYEDSFKYIGFMTGIAFIGFIYSTFNFIKLGLPKSLMILRGLDIITIVVPPALPATLTIGTTFAINRLKSYQIYCISPTRVNIGGKLDVICFDKTGTLTEDGLDVLGVHLVNNAEGRKEMAFDDLSKNIKTVNVSQRGTHDTNNGPLFIGLMSTCHSLRKIEDEILGDPLDYKMFEFTHSALKDFEIPVVENDCGNFKITRELEFESNLRRMSVVVETNVTKLVFCKGAPEVMSDICKPETLPADFFDLLYKYTNNGYRVIACAYKEVKGKESSRESLESKLNFLGFIIFENKLKSETTSTIRQLKDARIRTVMCTGDNILTGISVGRECGIINKDEIIYVPQFNEDEELVWQDISDDSNRLDSRTLLPLSSISKNYKFAITGDFFKYLLTNFKDEDIVHKVLLSCEIFARMSPDEKHELVNQLQNIDYTVGFIGDGANDCGALKAANVGVSLSEAEASIAAPFTSRIFQISCLLNVIKEGRSSLVTSFSSFKFMSLYSAIQFISVTILYKRGTNLGDFQFLYIDLFLILPLAIFMSWSKPNNKIIVKRPSANLVSAKILMSLIFNIGVLLAFQVFIWLCIQKQPWYEKPVPGDDENVKSYDNSILFLFTNFQYILISVLLSEGHPYRELMWNNTPYLVNLIASILVSAALFAVDSDSLLGNIFQLVNLPKKFYLLILVVSTVNYFALWLMEKYAYPRIHALYKRLVNRKHSKKLYKNLKKEFDVYIGV